MISLAKPCEELWGPNPKILYQTLNEAMQNLSIARKTIAEPNSLQHFHQQQRGHLVQLGLSLRLEAIKAMQRQQVAVESLRALRDVLLQRNSVWFVG